MEKIKEFISKNRIYIGLAILSIFLVVIFVILRNSEYKTSPNETTTVEQVSFVKVIDINFNDSDEVTSITFNGVKYTIPDDVKEEFEDTSEYVYVMNDGQVFHIIDNEVYVEVVDSESISTEGMITTDTSDTSSLTETTSEVVPETQLTTEETTTVAIETTTQQETTTKAPETTKKPEPTTKKEETTTKPEVVYDLSEDNRIKKCELWLISKLHEFDRWDDNVGDYVPCTMYESTKGYEQYNPYTIERALGWENVLVQCQAVLRSPYEEEDDFSLKHPDDTYAGVVERDVQWSKKYYEAVINDCEEWVKNGGKTSAEDFEKYLISRYTYFGENSIFINSTNPDGFTNDEYMMRTKDFCEKWCYYDNHDKQYKPDFASITDFAVYTYEKKGYFDDINEVMKWIQFTGDGVYHEDKGYGCLYYTSAYNFVRWTYDKDTDKTIIYMVFATQ